MFKIKIKILAGFIGFIIISHQAQAWEFDAEVCLRITTEYHDCQGYVDNIVELCRLYLSSEDPSNKSFIKERVKDFSKFLKNCEKDNRKRNTDTTIKIGSKQEF